MITLSLRNWPVAKYRKLAESPRSQWKLCHHVVRPLNLQKVWTSNVRWSTQRDRLIYHNQGLDTVIDEVLDDFIDQGYGWGRFLKSGKIFITLSCVISARINEIPKDLDLNNREEAYQFAYRNWMLRSRLKTKNLTSGFQRLSMLKAVDDNPWAGRLSATTSDGHW